MYYETLIKVVDLLDFNKLSNKLMFLFPNDLVQKSVWT